MVDHCINFTIFFDDFNLQETLLLFLMQQSQVFPSHYFHNHHLESISHKQMNPLNKGFVVA